MDLQRLNYNSAIFFDPSDNSNAVFDSVNPDSSNNSSPVAFHFSHPAIVCVSNLLMNDSEEDLLSAWHLSADHQDIRDTMVDCINHLILQRRPTASSEWITKLPLVSKQIEKKLYHTAQSIDE